MMKPLLLSCLLLLTGLVYAQTWTRYAQTDQASQYFDKHRVIKMGSTAMIWDLHDLKKAALDAKGNSYRSILYATEYNCRMGQYRILSVQKLASPMGSGEVIAEETEAGAWHNAADSTAADKLLVEACDLK
jgi:hypothetical protein